MGFKETLKDELTFQDMQTKELAVKTGISLSTLNHYLSGNGNVPSAENAIKIARTLGVVKIFVGVTCTRERRGIYHSADVVAIKNPSTVCRGKFFYV